MKKTNKNMNSGVGFGMCIGAAIGTSLGVAFDNIALGVALGISIGLAVGVTSGANKDKLVNEQLENKGYTVKDIQPKENKEYSITIEDKSGETIDVVIPEGIMATELFSVGDVVFLDDDGMIEQAFDEEEKELQ